MKNSLGCRLGCTKPGTHENRIIIIINAECFYTATYRFSDRGSKEWYGKNCGGECDCGIERREVPHPINPEIYNNYISIIESGIPARNVPNGT